MIEMHFKFHTSALFHSFAQNNKLTFSVVMMHSCGGMFCVMFVLVDGVECSFNCIMRTFIDLSSA